MDLYEEESASEPQESGTSTNIDSDFEPEPKKEHKEIPEESILKALEYYRSAQKGYRSLQAMRSRGFTWIYSKHDIERILLR